MEFTNIKEIFEKAMDIVDSKIMDTPSKTMDICTNIRKYLGNIHPLMTFGDAKSKTVLIDDINITVLYVEYLNPVAKGFSKDYVEDGGDISIILDDISLDQSIIVTDIRPDTSKISEQMSLFAVIADRLLSSVIEDVDQNVFTFGMIMYLMKKFVIGVNRESFIKAIPEFILNGIYDWERKYSKTDMEFIQANKNIIDFFLEDYQTYYSPNPMAIVLTGTYARYKIYTHTVLSEYSN